MNRKHWGLGLIMAGALTLAACGGQPAPATQPEPTAAAGEPRPSSAPAQATAPSATAVVSPLPTPGAADSPLAVPGSPAEDLEGLVAALTAAGATVETGERVEQPFFEVEGQALQVNGELVEVFEWADEASREVVSETITPEGQFGTTMVEWIATPHFWASGKLIALYVGDDAELVELLTGALGAPITKG